MNYLTLAIGIVALLFGFYTMILRTKSPEKFRKLEPMKKQWGEKAGYIYHFIGYTVVPWVVGIILIIKGIQGGSIL